MNDLDQFLLFYDTNSNILNRFVSFHIFVERPPYQENPKRPVNRHPINRLRNLAMRNIQTDFVFLSDIDFIPTANAHDQLAPLVQRDLSPKTLWVLPAFERFSDNKKKPITDVNLIPKTKLDLRKAIDAKHVAPFHEYFKPGHGPTQYKKWISSEQMYTIEYHYLFEPYVIAHRQGLPQYFPEFRGFANNKMTWFVEAHLLGYKFEVLPQHFVVHMNHSGRKGRSDRGGDSHIIKEHFKHYLKKVYKVSDLELVLW
eukprot:CAMPEP_0202473784 /NCGR_PEP_ID=MMETSP1360-20130828/91982_1 /ASSEMBLY_ACC=CAM_ASM_000848 /TAXON_ID=515479 /ORGANISM="Licmophora paradoxa, Strain CCMP2313" /LENGTH=255 /DNA_ID=CAMNT_0049100845 /DNA_START=211 /DNA_END=978 /DNA_ORIENTATION=-